MNNDFYDWSKVGTFDTQLQGSVDNESYNYFRVKSYFLSGKQSKGKNIRKFQVKTKTRIRSS